MIKTPQKPERKPSRLFPGQLGATAGTSNTSTEFKHQISFHILKLRKPESQFSLPIVYDKKDLLSKLPQTQKTLYPHKSLLKDTDLVMDTYGYGQEFSISYLENFGTLYAGENFTALLSICNDSLSSVKLTSFKVDFSNRASKWSLIDYSNILIEHNNHQEFTIDQLLSDEGDFILSVTAGYLSDDGEFRLLKKEFSLQVKLPISIKNIKCHFLITPHPSPSIFVTFDIQNLQENSLYLDSVKFDGNSFLYQIIDRSTNNTGPEYDHPMLPQESRRFLYELIPLDISKDTPKDLGKVNITWKTSMGDQGSWTSSMVSHNFSKELPLLSAIKNSKDLGLIVSEVSPLKNGTPFFIKTQITNKTHAKMDLIVAFDVKVMYPITVNGPSTKKIGLLEAGEKKEVSLEFFTLSNGLLQLGNGIVFKDTLTGKFMHCGTLLVLTIF